MYSSRLLSDQCSGGELTIAPMFEVLSANFTKLASSLFFGAFMIFCSFQDAFGSALSSVSSATISATSLLKRVSSSASDVGGQSSTVSCSQAAAMALSEQIQRSTRAATVQRQ